MPLRALSRLVALEKKMPALFAEMRADLKDHPFRRKCLPAKRIWNYSGANDYFFYYYDDHPELDGMMQVLSNHGLLLKDHRWNDERFIIQEELAEYLSGEVSSPLAASESTPTSLQVAALAPALPEASLTGPGSSSNEAPGFVFQKVGAFWAVAFGGTTAHAADFIGMGYIAELLRRPRTPIEADTLVTTIRANTDTAVDIAEERIVRAGAAMPGIPLTDAKAIKAVKAELAKKQLELKDSQADDETTRATQREISQLQDYLAQVKGHHGRPRTTGGTASRARMLHFIDGVAVTLTVQLASETQSSCGPS